MTLFTRLTRADHVSKGHRHRSLSTNAQDLFSLALLATIGAASTGGAQSVHAKMKPCVQWGACSSAFRTTACFDYISSSE
jgi:hypothetical protein